MPHRTERIIITICTLSALFALMAGSKSAVSAAAQGLEVCISVVVPSLLPFFVISSVLCSYGFPAAVGRRLDGAAQRLFGLSGECAAAFFIGLTGGYPLGAAAVADIYRSGRVSRSEAESMLAFCNNTGPAFIIGTAGAGIFGSVRIGLELYLAHILAAVLVGVVMPRGAGTARACGSISASEPPSFPDTLVSAVKGAAASVLNICAFVVFFSAVLGVFRASGLTELICGELSLRLPLSLRQANALFTGALELGSGISALSGCAPDGVSLAVCAFILGWGGLSVHCQTMAAISGTDLRPGRHFAGRALHGAFSAVIVLLFSLV